MPSTLDDLREQLMETLKDLRAKDKPMEVERAKAISEVAQTFINSAKAEVDYVKATGAADTAELPVFGARQKQITGPGQPRLVQGKAQSGSK